MRRGRKPKTKQIIMTSIGAAAIPTALTFALFTSTPVKPKVGWVKEYESFLTKEITENSDLPLLESSRMKNIAPNWAGMSASKRTEFLVKLISCMAKAESGYNRLAMFREYGIKAKDSVTGYPIISEGLLQLSYADERNYKGGCDWDWDKDKKLFIKDINSTSKQTFSGSDGRSILDPYKNLRCGVEIMGSLARNARYKTSSARYAWSRYWSTLRPERSGYETTKKCMKEKGENI